MPAPRLVLVLVLVLVFVSLLAADLGCSKSAEASQGPALFASTCSRCHGADGAGGLPLFEGGPSPRNFHDHDFQRSRTDEQLKQIIVNGKGAAMPAFGKTFTDAQLAQLVAHVRSFDSNGEGSSRGALRPSNQ